MDLLLKVDKRGHDQVVRAKIKALRDAKQGIQDCSAPLDQMLERKKVGAQHHIYKEHPRWKLLPQKDQISINFPREYADHVP